MAMSQIENEQWDFVEANGVEVRLPPASGELHLPAMWRLFGPLNAPTSKTSVQSVGGLSRAAIDNASQIPETLKVDGQTLQGRDVELTEGVLDLSAQFGSHGSGLQAFLFGQLQVPADSEIAIGAGCDFWMRWWIDGQLVLDTMDNGNIKFGIDHTDHCFRHALTAGMHQVVIQLVSPDEDYGSKQTFPNYHRIVTRTDEDTGAVLWVFKTKALTPIEEAAALLNTIEPQRWAFSLEPREMRPPRGRRNWQYVTAIRTEQTFGDVTVECEYKQDLNASNVGIVLGAQDCDHYYYAYVPAWGQLWRARASYAAIGIADGSDRIRNLAMQLMPNVPSQIDMWRTLKVERRGDEIQLWVGGVKGPCVRDQTYGSGRIGVAGFGDFRVRELAVTGQTVEAGPWVADRERGRPWYHIEDDVTLGDNQHPGQMVRLGDQIIIPILFGRKATSCFKLNETNSAIYLYSSDDAGRTWHRYAGPISPKAPAEGSWFVLEPDVIRAVRFDATNRRFTLRDSRDRAITWCEPVAGKLTGDWERDLFRPGCWNHLFGFTVLNDGTLLAVLLHGYEDMYDAIPHHGQGTWGTELAQPYCTLSHDRGLSWSEPVPMDHAASQLSATPDSPCGGFSETSVTQLPDGKIVALARPFRAPFMWQTESTDGGWTWRQACYAPFTGAGSPQLVATRSGYLVSVKRGPGVGVHCSLDGGLNWDAGVMIDFTGTFNGCAIEVEPDVVLVTYPQSMNEIRPSYACAQRITITLEGIGADCPS